MLTVINIPNSLTILRVLGIPCFLILLGDGRNGEALAVFVAAAVTDGLDGAIARFTHTKTTLGAILDPAADKMLLLSAFIALGFMHAVPPWLVVVVISDRPGVTHPPRPGPAGAPRGDLLPDRCGDLPRRPAVHVPWAHLVAGPGADGRGE
jgi:hypothetical protein